MNQNLILRVVLDFLTHSPFWNGKKDLYVLFDVSYCKIAAVT